jgi:hypothetical protein
VCQTQYTVASSRSIAVHRLDGKTTAHSRLRAFPCSHMLSWMKHGRERRRPSICSGKIPIFESLYAVRRFRIVPTRCSSINDSCRQYDSFSQRTLMSPYPPIPFTLPRHIPESILGMLEQGPQIPRPYFGGLRDPVLDRGKIGQEGYTLRSSLGHLTRGRAVSGYSGIGVKVSWMDGVSEMRLYR